MLFRGSIPNIQSILSFFSAQKRETSSTDLCDPFFHLFCALESFSLCVLGSLFSLKRYYTTIVIREMIDFMLRKSSKCFQNILMILLGDERVR